MKEEYIVETLKKTYSHIDLREFADNFYIFKDEYDRVRNLPSITTHNKMDLMLEWKNFIYSLDNGRELYRKDKMWEALNDDITKEELDRFVQAVYTGR